jgi:hypothetical protein
VRFSFVLALAISLRALVDIFYIRPIEFEIHQCLEQLAEPIARTFDPFLESCWKALERWLKQTHDVKHYLPHFRVERLRYNL